MNKVMDAGKMLKLISYMNELSRRLNEGITYTEFICEHLPKEGLTVEVSEENAYQFAEGKNVYAGSQESVLHDIRALSGDMHAFVKLNLTNETFMIRIECDKFTVTKNGWE